jgi:hypothetical protein
MKYKHDRVFYSIFLTFFIIVAAATIYISHIKHDNFADAIVAATALIGIYAMYIQSKRGKDIAIGEFILNLNSEFDENTERAMIHKKLIYGDAIIIDDKPAIVSYLSFFEIVYRLIERGIIQIDVIDDLFRSRFFKAIYNIDIQNLELLPDADGYLNIYKLEQIWLAYLKKSNIELKRGDRVLPQSARKRATEQKHFTFSPANSNEAEEIHRIMVMADESVVAKNEKTLDLFYLNDLKTVETNMNSGFVIKAYSGDKLAGIILVHFPSMDESHARKVGDKYISEEIAHMDVGAVLNDYRGFGLLELLLIEAERYLKNNFPQKKILYSTIHPENRPSIKSSEFSQYIKVGDTRIHGNHPRSIYRKIIK